MTDPTQYSNTLHVPRPDSKDPSGLDSNVTGIPQRANLPVREPAILKFWKENEVYRKSLAKSAPKGDFILHDGPPFSNGNIHIGHAFNKILKDITLKYRSSQGYRTPYTPGWDNNGQPIEVLVVKEFLQNKQAPTPMEIRKRCRAVAEEWVEKQSEQFQRLGVTGDWADPYLTMSPRMVVKEIEVFAEMVESGYVFRGLRPVHWSLVDETALADHEIEYQDRKDPSIHVRFLLLSDPNGIFGGHDPGRCATVIWTTTPWTIPANVAVAVGPELEYVVAEHEGTRFIVAAERMDETLEAIGWQDARVIRSVTGKELKGLVFKHPLFDRESPMVTADYVTTTDGTGVVHTAPGHGKDDFATGQKYGLPTLQVLTGNGYFNDEAGPEFSGLKMAGPGQLRVLERLREEEALLAQEEILHSYPHGWRSHDPLVFRATVQWFVDIDHNGHRDRCLQEIDRVEWFPADSINRIRSMVGNRPDWCISRQRHWGVGIPVFYAQPSGTPLLTRESIMAVRDLILKRGTDAWFTEPAEAILPAGFKHPETGETEFVKETDIFDVWFDSGATCRTVLEQWPGLRYPADLYLEGGDQHRGWFNASLMIGMGTKGEAPFRQVVTNGWTLDDKGRAMHKSLGNVVAPQAIIDKYGADVLRLWVCSTDYFADVKIGGGIVDQVATSYRTIRNTLRFAVGNLYVAEPEDFDPHKHAVPLEELSDLHRWALHRLNEVVRSTTQSYEVYEFHKVAQTVLGFCASDLSAFTFDVLKDTLYTHAADSKERRGAQTVLFEITSTLTRLLAPILPFTAEEVWQKLRQDGKALSVLLAELPTYRPELADAGLEEKWSVFLHVRDEVNKTLEGVKKRLEQSITISAPREIFDLLLPYWSQLPSLLLVSQVRLTEKTEGSLTVTCLGTALGDRCARCWQQVTDASVPGDPAADCKDGCKRSWRVVGGEGAIRQL